MALTQFAPCLPAKFDWDQVIHKSLSARVSIGLLMTISRVLSIAFVAWRAGDGERGNDGDFGEARGKPGAQV